MPKLLRAGATRTVRPTPSRGGAWPRRCCTPRCSTPPPAAEGPHLQMEEQIVLPGSALDGKTVAPAAACTAGTMLVAIRRRDGHVAFNPEDDTPVVAGDVLITLGNSEQRKAPSASSLVARRQRLGRGTRARGRGSSLGATVLGALLGGLAGGFVVVGVTLVLKAGMELVSRQDTWLVVVVPLVGLALAVLVLQGLGKSATPSAQPRRRPGWRTFPSDAARADISRDVVDSAGEEERFPWRLAPIRALAILATVGMGGAMGTEAPAAYLGVAAGAYLGDRGHGWRRLLRPAALAGGAAGVGALMGIALVGTAFMLELGRRRRAPLSIERVMAALIGGLVGWGIDDLRPQLDPPGRAQGAADELRAGGDDRAVHRGGIGRISSLAGMAVYAAKNWRAPPALRLAIGGAATVATALVLAKIATPSAAVGPGGGAILWAESANAIPLMLLAVCLLRAVATTAAVAAGGCGGVFVPFLAVGDLAGRVFAPGLDVGNDFAGAAGAAGGVAGGYRLPFTAAAMVLGVGGPPRATLTCLATLAVAFYAAKGVETAFGKLKGLVASRR